MGMKAEYLGNKELLKLEKNCYKIQLFGNFEQLMLTERFIW